MLYSYYYYVVVICSLFEISEGFSGNSAEERPLWIWTESGRYMPIILGFLYPFECVPVLVKEYIHVMNLSS